MKIVSIYIFDIDQKICQSTENLLFINVFHRTFVKELMREFAIHAAESLDEIERKIFEHNDFQFICQRINSLATVIVTDKEYPSRSSFELTKQILNLPTEKHIQKIIDERQDGLDAIGRIKRDIDQTLVIAHENIDKVLSRGHDIDELVEKSANLSNASKTFYKTARKHNRCCTIS